MKRTVAERSRGSWRANRTSLPVAVLLAWALLAAPCDQAVAVQLPPEVLLDSYILEAEQAIDDGNPTRAQSAINNIIELQNEHDLDLPDEFHFRYASAAVAADLPEQALESIVTYLEAVGRDGPHYVEALAVMSNAQTKISCDGWGDDRYFKTATLEQVTACLETGTKDVNAENDAGWTPLHEAAYYNSNPAVTEALLAAGADVNAEDNDGWTPLYMAANIGTRDRSAVIAVLRPAGGTE